MSGLFKTSLLIFSVFSFLHTIQSHIGLDLKHFKHLINPNNFENLRIKTNNFENSRVLLISGNRYDQLPGNRLKRYINEQIKQNIRFYWT